MLASRMKIHDFITCYGEHSLHIHVPIRVASAALAAGVAMALLVASAQAATSTSSGHAASAKATASSKAAASQPAKPPLTAAQLHADRQRQDAALSTTSSLTGLARTATGKPLAGVCVTAYGRAASKAAVTRSDGRYTISGLRPGRYQIQYRTCAGAAQQYLPEWYGDVLQRSQSRTVTVNGSSLTPLQALAPVTLYPANSTLGDLPGAVIPQHGSDEMASDPFGHLATAPSSPANLMKSLVARYLPRASRPASGSRTGRISGVVSSPKGHGLKGICVEVAGPGGFTIAVTGKDGAYRTPRLLAGKYAMAFYADCGNTGNWLTQIYKNIYNPAKRPTFVKIKAGRTTDHISVVMKDGSEISGTVTGPGGRKLSGICVYPLTSSPAGELLFNAESRHGAYHIRSLPRGSYQIGFASCGLSDFAPTLWPHTQSYRSAKYIHVHGTRHVGNIDEVMQPGGVVTGTVTAAVNSPAPLAGMCVMAFENNGLGVVGTAATSATGGYKIFGLAPGPYSVQFFPGCNNNGNYVGVNYPKNVKVTDGTTTSGINAALPVGAIISGKVTSAATGMPLGGICVGINTTFQGVSGEIGFETTNASGRYSVDQLPVGKYQVQFIGGCGNSGSYAPQGWPDTNVLEPHDIDVAAAGDHVTGIGAALQPGPVIAGSVTDSSGHKLSGICVDVFTPSGAEFGFGLSVQGHYQAPDLAPGSYEVLFSPGCGDNANLAQEEFKSQVSGTTVDTVSVTSGTLNGINAVMQPAGSISGVVRTASGHSVGFSCLILTGVSGQAKSLLGEALLFGSRYKLAGLPAGGYKVTFAPNCVNSALQEQWYKDKPSPAGATTVRVRAFHNDKAINSQLRTGGSIAGQITNGGKPVRNMCVFAQNVKVFLDFGGAISNREGQFVMRGLNSGTYELQVQPCGPGSNALASEVLPQVVHVTAPRRTTGVKIAAVRGATITGTVQAGSLADDRAAGACVEAFGIKGTAYNLTNAGLDGNFSITNLPPGQYSVYVGDQGCSFSEPNLAPQWYLGKSTEREATPVSVSLGGTTTLSSAIALADDGSISGTVTGQHGSPLRGVCVAATAAGSGPVYSVTGSAGSYSISDLPAGHYRVQFSSGCGAAGYRTQWWRQSSTRKSARIVLVTAGTATTGISAKLRK